MTVLGRVGRAPAVALWVDPKVHAAEIARFRSKIVAGPGDRDCSIWIAASEPMVTASLLHYPCGHGILRAAQPVCAGVGHRICSGCGRVWRDPEKWWMRVVHRWVQVAAYRVWIPGERREFKAPGSTTDATTGSSDDTVA